MNKILGFHEDPRKLKYSFCINVGLSIDDGDVVKSVISKRHRHMLVIRTYSYPMISYFLRERPTLFCFSKHMVIIDKWVPVADCGSLFCEYRGRGLAFC